MWRRPLVALALLALWPGGAGATAVPQAGYLPYGPATALSGNDVVVAWAAGGAIRTATRSANGVLGASQVVGRSLDDLAPLLASAPNGDLTLIWIGEDGVDSAFRPAGTRAWTLEPFLPGSVGPKQIMHLVVDATGRAIVLGEFLEGGDSFATFTHDPGGTWVTVDLPSGSTPLRESITLATDTVGDTVIAYPGTLTSDGTGGPTRVFASLLAPGATRWTAPVAISGPEPVSTVGVTLAAGGARTFVATWQAPGATTSGSTTWGARLRLPGTWEAERTVIPAEPEPLAESSDHVASVDEQGNATALWRYPTDTGAAIGFATLPAGETAWSAPAPFDHPPGPRASDALPAVANAPDGSAAIAFLQRRDDGFWLRVATKDSSGAWSGQDDDAARISRCSDPETCIWEKLLPPSLAFDGRAAVVSAKTSAGMVTLGRNALGAPWSRAASLKPSETTNVYLRSAHVRDGAMQVAGSCGASYCAASVVIRTLGARPRVVGHVSLDGLPDTPRRVPLPRWARARLRHGRLRVELLATYNVEGMPDRASLIVALHS